ncbi:MAG: hypothetical protein V5A43_04095, partial [Haloarculaceae archaeon]
MTDTNLGRLLLVAVAIVGLAFAASVVSAHGDEPTQWNETTAEERPAHSDAANWAIWMESHMTDHMGPGAVDVMESYIGVSVAEMAQYMAEAGHPDDDHSVDDGYRTGADDRTVADGYRTGMDDDPTVA